MAYDETKEEIFWTGIEHVSENVVLQVQIKSYSGGPRKIAMSRIRDGRFKPSVGWLQPEEADVLAALLTEAAEVFRKMQKANAPPAVPDDLKPVKKTRKRKAPVKNTPARKWGGLGKK